MFLRSTKRFKDGKVHRYWSLVENVRVGRRVFQRRALYLGELNDSQQAQWQRTVEAIDEDGKPKQMTLFPDDRAPATDEGSVVRIRMDRLTVKNLRNWGKVWLGTMLWDMLGLDEFWRKRLLPSRKGTDGRIVMLPRYIEPKEELSILLGRLGLTLPSQPPPKVSSEVAETMQMQV